MRDFPITLVVSAEDAGRRLDQYLATQLPDASRARVQQLIRAHRVLVNGAAAKVSLRLRGNETIIAALPPTPPSLRAMPENIPLDIAYEDADLAIINKPAGMMVHAGAGATEEARNRGTLVNALLHHFGALSGVGGELRPGIVHRLDRATSGLMVVSKNDESHRRLARQFSRREVHKTYIALVHGWPKKDRGTVQTAISRDLQRRTRMTTRRSGGREAVTHYLVTRKIDSPYGKFAMLELKIETGRTHQIRVHIASLGHPVVGDTLYGAPRELRTESGKIRASGAPGKIALGRNFLHSAKLEFAHPRTGERLSFARELPEELEDLVAQLGLQEASSGESPGHTRPLD
jgi:23S rRNA pseudouridine1911/1915/1917 synthase